MTTVMKGDTWHMGMTRRSKRIRVLNAGVSSTVGKVQQRATR